MKKLSLTLKSALLVCTIAFIFANCRQPAEKDSQETIKEDTIVSVGNDTTWLYLYVQAQSVHIRKKPELLSEPCGILHYGDSVYGYYIQDSVWFQLLKDGEDAFLKTEYLTSLLLPRKDTVMSLADVKKELRKHFSDANISFKNGQFTYPYKTFTVTVPKKIKTIELGNIAYRDLEKLNKEFGLGGVRLCTDISADKNALYTSTAVEGSKITFYSLGALNMELSNIWDTTSKSLPTRIVNGDVTFIKGEIR
jgi:hypothetical protein